MRPAQPLRKRAVAASTVDVLFWLFVVGVLVRSFLPNDYLDSVYPYSMPGGLPFLKIHPGSYLIFFSAGVAAFRPMNGDSRGMVLPAALLAVLSTVGVGWTLATGNTTSIGALFDLYLVAAAGLFAVSRFTPPQREMLFHILLIAFCANAAVLVAEFALQRRLVTLIGATTSGVFRPAGFMNHPLIDGLVYATVAPLLVRLRGPLSIRVALSGLAVAVVLISGARFASIVALALLPLTVAFAVRSEPRRPAAQQGIAWLQVAAIGVGLPLLAAAALLGGLGYRFTGSLVDESSLKRLNDFQLLSYLTPHDWWFGGGVTALEAWSVRLFNGASIENSVVIGIFTYGLPMTVVLLGCVGLSLALLGMRSGAAERIALFSFILVASSNNALMVKSPTLMLAVIAVAAVGGGTLARRNGPTARWRTFRSPRPAARWRNAGAPSPSPPALARSRSAIGGRRRSDAG